MIRLLGPLELLVEGESRALGSPKQKAVLAILALAAGRVVSTDRLVEELWGENPPESSVSTLQVYISRIRSAVTGRSEPAGAPVVRVLRRAPGYALEVPDDGLDTRRFHHMMAVAAQRLTDDPGWARTQLDAALAMTTGHPLGDLVEQLGPASSVEVERLAEMVLRAQELRLQAMLLLGESTAVAQDAAPLVSRHPLRESLCGILVLALYRAGRQAEALEAYETVRRDLADELGVDPTPALRRLHTQILRHDPALDLIPASTPVVTFPTPPSGTPISALHEPGVDSGPDLPGQRGQNLLPDASLPAPDSVLTPVAEQAPPITGVATRNHNLPDSLTKLIGRTDQLQLLAALLEEHRLVTILGTGGIGKTRLALEAAWSREDSDGPWFVELAALNDGTLLVEIIANTIGISAPGGLSSLITVLQHRQMLLILDNCEQISEDVTACVTAILEHCTQVKVLATSRQTLGTAGGVVLDLPPLLDAEAEELFLVRASTATPGWILESADRRPLTELCAGLDYLPLAIELAAAQCRALSVRQLADHLGDRFAVLSGHSSNRRHATMTAAVAWSYDSLSDEEREVFENLAMLEGTFDLEGASAVTARRSVVQWLLALIDKSMVAIVGGNPRRYRILETLRQYAAERRSPAATALARSRVVAWVCSVADVADDELHGPRSGEWMDRLDTHKDTIRAAIDWAENDQATRLRIAIGMVWYWFRRGHVREGLRALQPPVTISASTPGVTVPALIRRSVGVVLLSYLAGDYDLVTDGLAEAGALVANTDEVGAQAYAMCTIAFFEAAAGQTAAALDHATIGFDLAQRAGSPQRAAEALQSLGMAHLRSDNLPEAGRSLTAAVAQADACGYRWCEVSSLWILAKVRIAEGDYPEAASRLVRMLLVCEEDANLTSWLVGLVSLGYVHLRRGDSALAAELTGIADQQSELIGFTPDVMDPVETNSYRTQIITTITAQELSTVYARGRSLATDDAFRRVREVTGSIRR